MSEFGQLKIAITSVQKLLGHFEKYFDAQQTLEDRGPIGPGSWRIASSEERCEHDSLQGLAGCSGSTFEQKMLQALMLHCRSRDSNIILLGNIPGIIVPEGFG